MTFSPVEPIALLTFGRDAVKTLGILGGIGPESTIDYYRLIVDGYRQRSGGRAPSVLINSIDVGVVLELASADATRAQLVDYLASGLRRLAEGGASFALMAANTPHIVFDELVRASPVPLLSIVEGVRHAAPDAADEAFVHERYTRELVPGHFREETRREFAAMREARGIAVPLLDSARLHADEAVSRMLA